MIFLYILSLLMVGITAWFVGKGIPKHYEIYGISMTGMVVACILWVAVTGN